MWGEENMTTITNVRRVLAGTGLIGLVVGAIGLMAPLYLGAHIGITHNLTHAVAGALAFWVATRADGESVRSFATVFGLFFICVGVAGFIAGRPGAQSGVYAAMDPNLMRLIPGTLEFGSVDHMFHLLTGLACAAAGMDSFRPGAIVRDLRHTGQDIRHLVHR